jgi:hypothetical protein
MGLFELRWKLKAGANCGIEPKTPDLIQEEHGGALTALRSQEEQVEHQRLQAVLSLVVAR